MVLFLSGCGDAGTIDPQDRTAAEQSVAIEAAARVPDRQTAFRVRGDDTASLNDDGSWAAAVNTPATVVADRPFRLRFEVEAGGAPDPRQYRLQVRRNGGFWQPLPAERFPYPLKEERLLPPATATGARTEIWESQSGEDATIRVATEDGYRFWRAETRDRPLLALARHRIEWKPTEFTVELRLNDDRRARAGVVFDHIDGDNFSQVELVGPDTLRLVRVAAGHASILAEQSIGLDLDRWLELNINVRGDRVTVEVSGNEAIVDQALPNAPSSPRVGIWMPESSVADYRVFVVETEATTPRSSIIQSASFEHGAPTRDLLRVSDLPFTGGAGISFAERTPAWTPDGGHGEWSFPIVIRRFADEAMMNEDGDRFDYRLVGAGGKPVPTDLVASVRLQVPEGHLGGTFVETPMRLGPWQSSNGDLYFIMEPSETWNRMMIVKSTDGGRSWLEVDAANRPETGDLEGLGSVFVDGRIHILHQVSEKVVYHAFDTVDRGSNPDAWVIRDAPVAAPPQPPTQVADLAVRSDGSIVAVYGDGERIGISVRSSDGSWNPAHRISGPGGAVVSGPSVVVDDDDIVHLGYTASDGTAWYRRFQPDGTLDAAVEFASNLATGAEDVGAILPLLDLFAADSIAILYRTRDGRLHERRVDARGAWTEPATVTRRIVARNPVDSDQVAADAVTDGESIQVLFVESKTGQLFHTAWRNGRWREAESVVTDATVQWVRGHVVKSSDGTPVYGFVYDGGSNGGSGMNAYRQIPLGDP